MPSGMYEFITMLRWITLRPAWMRMLLLEALTFTSAQAATRPRSHLAARSSRTSWPTWSRTTLWRRRQAFRILSRKQNRRHRTSPKGVLHQFNMHRNTRRSRFQVAPRRLGRAPLSSELLEPALAQSRLRRSEESVSEQPLVLEP